MFSRLAQFALVALALTISNQANTAPLVFGTYYDETLSLNCDNVSTCRINFSQLPADKLLMVQKINCSIISSQPVIRALFRISTTLGGDGLLRLLPMAVPPSQQVTGYHTNFREDTHFLVGNGRFPFVLASALD